MNVNQMATQGKYTKVMLVVNIHIPSKPLSVVSSQEGPVADECREFVRFYRRRRALV